MRVEKVGEGEFWKPDYPSLKRNSFFYLLFIHSFILYLISFFPFSCWYGYIKRIYEHQVKPLRSYFFLLHSPLFFIQKKKKKTFAPYFTHQLLFVSKRHEKYIHAQISFAFINLLCYSHSKNIESISSLVLHVSPIWRTFFFLFLFLHIYSQRHTSHLSFYFSYYFSKNNFFLAFFSVFWYAKWDWIDEK